jgi:hypothetical protein
VQPDELSERDGLSEPDQLSEPDALRRYHDGPSPTFRAPAATSTDVPPVPPVPAPADALAFLRGTWRVERELVDHADEARGRFTGTAQWAPAGERELAYHEQGELSIRGHRGPASRSLIYRGCPDGTADVRFADGRAFYHLDLRAGRWQAVHDCGADQYVLSGQLLSAEIYSERWHVRGPGKDYEIMTTLVRTEQDGDQVAAAQSAQSTAGRAARS